MAFGGETPESYYDEGVTASMRGDLAEAIKHFERAAELDQAFVGAYHQLGKCYSRLGEPGKAMQYLQHVIRAKPNQIPPRVDFAYALLDSGDYEGARKLFDEVVSAKPDNQRAQLGFAYCAFQEGNWEAAMNLAQNVVRLGKASFAAQYLLGRAAALAGQDVAAMEALEAAEGMMNQSIETTPEQPEGYYLRGCIQFVRENFKAAIEDFRLAEEKCRADQHYAAYGEHFDRLDILGRRGLCLQRVERLDEAREVGRLILEADPENKTGQVLAREQ